MGRTFYCTFTVLIFAHIKGFVNKWDSPSVAPARLRQRNVGLASKSRNEDGMSLRVEPKPCLEAALRSRRRCISVFFEARRRRAPRRKNENHYVICTYVRIFIKTKNKGLKNK